MNLQQLMPVSLWGWIGVGLVAYAAAYYHRLETMGKLLLIGGGLYLYFIVDPQTNTVTSTGA